MFGQKFIKRIIALAVGLMCCAAIAIGLTIWQLRSDAIDTAKEGAGNVATILARETEHSVRNLDLIMEEVVARIATYQPASQDDFNRLMARRDMHDFLATRLSRLPQADAINVTDNSGKILSSTRAFPAPSVNLADREAFARLAGRRDNQMFIGSPDFSKITGVWNMHFGRRVETADGIFLGIVLIPARPSKLLQLYGAISAIPGASSLLLRRDGVVYLRHPDPVERAGQTMPKTSDFYKVLEEGGGYFRSPGVFDAESRWVAVRPLEQYPLVVNVAVSEKSALAVWRSRATMIALGSLLAIVVMAILMRLILAGYRKTLSSEALLAERERGLSEKSRELSIANRRFEMALTNMRQGLAMFDSDDNLVIHNRGYAELYGLTGDQLPPGTPLQKILEMRVEKGIYTVDGPEEYVRRHRDHAGSTDTGIEEMSDGRYFLVTHCEMPGDGWLTTHEDVTERQCAIAQISHLAHHDPLTNLANRSLFLTRLEELGQRAGDNHRYAVMLLDLDRFKAVNDTFGHSAGDALLWAVAARMKLSVRSTDLIARLGGDEFAVVLSINGPQDSGIIERLAERLLSNISVPYEIDDRELKIGVSIGIAFSNDEATDPTEIMRFADLAMYRAKADGKNCYRVFAPEMEAAARSRRQLALDLDTAIFSGQIDVHYQPVVDTTSLEVRGMEALVRWVHPTNGSISPALFVNLAEQAGLIDILGDFVLERACHDALAWPQSVKVAVNVSPLQIASTGFVEKVRRALRDSGLPPRRLELEITESVLLNDNAQNISVLHGLRDLGVGIVLDDFGTGFSSLSYLNQFPFDKIKIDKSFIDGLGVHAGASAIISATTSIARALQAVTTAEGVETEEQAVLLRAAAVTQLQGYLYGKPRPSADWRFIDGKAILRDPSPGKFLAAPQFAVQAS